MYLFNLLNLSNDMSLTLCVLPNILSNLIIEFWFITTSRCSTYFTIYFDCNSASQYNFINISWWEEAITYFIFVPLVLARKVFLFDLLSDICFKFFKKDLAVSSRWLKVQLHLNLVLRPNFKPRCRLTNSKHC